MKTRVDSKVNLKHCMYRLVLGVKDILFSTLLTLSFDLCIFKTFEYYLMTCTYKVSGREAGSRQCGAPWTPVMSRRMWWFLEADVRPVHGPWGLGHVGEAEGQHGPPRRLQVSVVTRCGLSCSGVQTGPRCDSVPETDIRVSSRVPVIPKRQSHGISGQKRPMCCLVWV